MVKRCLYCGIRLEVESAAIVIRHCPACSIGRESDDARRGLRRALRHEWFITTVEKEAARQGNVTALMLMND